MNDVVAASCSGKRYPARPQRADIRRAQRPRTFRASGARRDRLRARDVGRRSGDPRRGAVRRHHPLRGQRGKRRVDEDGLWLHGRQSSADAATGRHSASEVHFRVDARGLSADRPRRQRGRRHRPAAAYRPLCLHQAVLRPLRAGTRHSAPDPAHDDPARPLHPRQHGSPGADPTGLPALFGSRPRATISCMHDEIVEFMVQAMDSGISGAFNLGSEGLVHLSSIVDQLGLSVRYGEYPYDIGPVDSRKAGAMHPAFARPSWQTLNRYIDWLGPAFVGTGRLRGPDGHRRIWRPILQPFQATSRMRPRSAALTGRAHDPQCR